MKILLFSLLLIPFLFTRTHQLSSQPLVITHVTVIDISAPDSLRAVKLDQTVVITGNQITAVGKTGKVKVPPDSRVVDAEGRYMIPGLWDMHVHSMLEGRPEYFFPLFIANGITGVRDMGGGFSFDRLSQIRKQLASGKIVGPRLGAVAGRILDGPGARTNVGLAVGTADEAKQAVKAFKQGGADFIKVYDWLSREVYLAIVDEAKQQGLPVAGHVPFSMSAEEVSDLGQQSIEHTTDVFISSSRDEDELRKELRRQTESANGSQSSRVQAELKAVGSYDEGKARSLYARFAHNGTWQCPTLVVRRAAALADNNQLANDNRMKYIPSAVRNNWNETFKLIASTSDVEARKRRFQKTLEIVGAMQRAGVGILAGTDTLNPYVYPGFSLHDELGLLVQAGLTPMQALRTATLNPAKFLGLFETLGTIDKGRLADLVLLDANPLDDIRNTQRIHAVVANGRYFPREALQRLFAEAEAAAGK